MSRNLFLWVMLALALPGAAGAQDLGAPAYRAAQQAQAAIATTQQRLQWWSRSYAGPLPITVMASPPTVTENTSSTSTVDGTVVNTANVKANNSLFSYSGVSGVTFDGSGFATFQGGTDVNGAKQTANAARVRFMLDSPAFEVAINEASGTLINAKIDGAWVARAMDGTLPVPGNSGNTRFIRFDFGADTTTYGLTNPGSVSSAGTGYTNADIVQINGGTCTRQPKVRIAQVSSGAVSTAAMLDVGSCTVVPTAPYSTTAVTGAGSGYAMGTGFWAPFHTTRKMRQVELYIEATSTNFKFLGIVKGSGDSVLPWKFNPRVPKVAILSDSQEKGTYLNYAGGQQSMTYLQRIGLVDNAIILSFGGTGWETANGNYGPFSNANRLADVVAANPDIVVIDGSQNDSQTSGTVAGVCTAGVRSLQASLPNARIVLVGPSFSSASTSTYMASLATCAAGALDATRIRLVDNFSEGWGMNTNTYASAAPYITSDNAHIGQYGLDEYRTKIMADRIATKIIEMIP